MRAVFLICSDTCFQILLLYMPSTPSPFALRVICLLDHHQASFTYRLRSTTPAAYTAAALISIRCIGVPVPSHTPLHFAITVAITPTSVLQIPRLDGIRRRKRCPSLFHIALDQTFPDDSFARLDHPGR